MTRTPRQRRQRKTKTVMSAKEIRWEVVFVAESDEAEQKAMDDVMDILYEFGARKGLFMKTEPDAPQTEAPSVLIQQAVRIPSPLLA